MSDYQDQTNDRARISIKTLGFKPYGEQEGVNVLKKREDFAISLRKKKHHEMITTKRRANMQKAFERTIQNSCNQNNKSSENYEDGPFIDIKDENSLNELIMHIDLGITNEDLLLIVRTLRLITINYASSAVYKAMLENQFLIAKLMNVLLNDTLPLDIKAETLWVLTNLSCEPKQS